MPYKINILTNDEFDNLPKNITRGSEISDSLGFADPRTGQAYVRYTHFPELNSYLIDHELEELTQAESTHEDENGIRHKKLFGFIPLPGGSKPATPTPPTQPAPVPFQQAFGPLAQFNAPTADKSVPSTPNVAGGLNQDLGVASKALETIRGQGRFGDFQGRVRF